MSEETRHLLVILRGRLQAAARQITVANLAYSSLLTAGIVAALLLLLVGTEALFWVAVAWRSLFFWLLVLALGGLTIALVARPFLRLLGMLPHPPDRQVAQHVSHRYPELEDRLLNLLDLGEGRASAAPAHLVDGAVRMLHERVNGIPLEDATSFMPVRRMGRIASMPVAGLLLFLIAAPTSFLDASHRLFSPGVFFVRPASFALMVSPGDTTIVRGEALVITATATGINVPTSAVLQADRAQPATLAADASGRFSYEMVNVREAFRYRIQAGAITTSWFGIEVIERPVVRSLQVELVAPAYTGLPVQVLPPGTGDIFALPGTAAKLKVRGGEARAYLVFASGHVDTLSKGAIAEGSFSVREKDTYHVLLENEAGIRNHDPIVYQVTPLADLPPTVAIREPAADATLDLDIQATVLLQLSDDFGFRDLNLWWRLAESRYNEVMSEPVAMALPLARPRELDQHLEFYWDLRLTTALDIVPGDVIEYYAEVRDNDVISGYKSARSAVHRLRLPSVSERYDRLSDTQQDTESEMASLLEESDRIRAQFEEVRDELRRKQQGDWDDKRQLERVADAQKALEERVEGLASTMEETAEDMQDLVSDETLEMFEELQQVTEEINSPELMEAMQKLQQAIEELNPREMQMALEKFGFNEEMYRDRLERALELFRNFQVQQKLEEAANRAENLASEQEQLDQEIGEDPDAAQQERDALAEQQMRSKEEMEALESKMEEIARRMDEMRNAPTEAMDQLSEETAAQELPMEMQENAEQMQAGQMQEAQRGQRQMQQSLQQLQQDLESMLGGMQGSQMQINFAALQRLLSDILHLSHDQEALRRQVTAAATDSPLLREFAQQQSVMRDGLTAVADSLQSLARQIPQMTREVQTQTGTALLAMENAIAAMVARSGSQAAQEQLTSMTNLNELALLLSDLMDQLMNSPSNNSAGGMSMSEMIQQMQQMASQQQQLNQQIQEMLGQMQGQRLTPDMQARMQQMASQQQAIKQQLEELSRQSALAQRLAGDLNKIAAQMEESVQQLGAFGASRELRERQQQILTRLLDASRAMQERGKQRRREGHTGERIVRAGPDALDASRPDEVLRRALLDALESGYAPDYQELIRRYFELLQQKK